MRAAGVALLLALACCASTAEKTDSPPAAPAPEAAADPAPPAEPPAPRFPDRPTLSEVLAEAVKVPLVEASREAVVAEEGVRVQAGLWPDPVLSLRFEGIDLADDPGTLGRWRVLLRQKFETAGKRGARESVAEARVREARLEIRVTHLRVARAAALAHCRAAAGELLVLLRRDALTAAEALLKVEVEKVKAGRRDEGRVAALRARVGLLRSALSSAQADRWSAIRNLEGILGLAPDSLSGVSGGVLTSVDLPPMAADLLRENPELAALRADEEVALSRTEEARAEAWPDVTVGLSYEQFRSAPRDEAARSLGVWFDVPLPLFDRNQGGIAAASADRRRTRALAEQAESRLAAEYGEALMRAEALMEQRTTWVDEVLPGRERELELARAEHEGGRADRSAVLEARLGLLAARADLIDIDHALAVELITALYTLGREPAEWLADAAGKEQGS